MNAKIPSFLRISEDPLQLYAAQLIDELKEERRWIPVTERLPEENERYLTVMHRTVDPEYRAEFGDDNTEVRITRYYKGEWKLPRHSPEWINDVITDTITHWMPLPEPPKEE